MAKKTKSEKVPPQMLFIFEDIVKMTDEFSKTHLNEEYAQLIRYATAALCRKKPSPLNSGTIHAWASGITHAIGMINFLFDPSQDPHIGANDLYKWFGISASTGVSKSKIVRDLLKMRQFDPDWSRPSQLDKNPMAWMITLDGFIIDARHVSRDIQEIAYAKGLIPYIPDSGKQSNIPMTKNDKTKLASSNVLYLNNQTKSLSAKSLYIFEVFLVGGPITKAFIKKNPSISRTIEIQGSQTLEDLHDIIFEAFDRNDPHLYEFQIGGKGPNDPNATTYGSGEEYNDSPGSAKQSRDVSRSTIDSLGLNVDDAFGYWFDFGDDWWHQINVISITNNVPEGKYPKITQRVGKSPPQYPDHD
ncbi:MAG: plasmid pRiA4b ORF-3 family protein [SAR324 cluster bacterium]|nr:plasmid pRiA4b ORF-3 family protein [SAR324 cluster bacterium]